MTDDTIKKPIDNEINSELTLDAVDPTDKSVFKKLDLSLGQWALLKRAVYQRAKENGDLPPQEKKETGQVVEEHPVTAKDVKGGLKMSRDIDSELLDLFLAAEPSTGKGYQYTEGKPTAMKPLYIHDFVKSHKTDMNYEEEEELLTSKLGTLTLRSSRKPQIEKMTINL